MKEILGGNKMSEPTREQIKGAFKKTIERWEKIVEDVEYFHESNCALCRLGQIHDSCKEKACPIFLYTNERSCIDTPYSEFDHEKTPANALAELNFLRKVYIWWMEGESKKDWWTKVKEEKKEEWVDVTKETTWKVGGVCHDYWLEGLHDGKVVFLTAENTKIDLNEKSDEENYKVVETPTGAFRILKKT